MPQHDPPAGPADPTAGRGAPVSQHFLAHALGQVDDAVIIVDATYRVVYLNARATLQYEVDPAAAVGCLLTDLYRYQWLHPDDEEAAMQALATGGAWRGENCHVLPSGKTLYVDSTVTRLQDEGGATFLVAVIRDITAKKEAATAFATAQQWQQLAIDGAGLGTWTLDLTTNTLQWDARCREILGVTLDSPAPNTGVFGIIHPDDRPQALAAFARAADPAGDGLYVVEQRTLRPDGSLRWVSVRGQMLFSESNGARVPQRLTGIVSDIHARVETLQGLQRAHQRAAFAEAAVRGFVYEWNFQAGTVERTDGIYEVLGYHPDELAGDIATWRELIHPDDYARVGTSQIDRLLTHDTYTHEYRLRHRAGHYIQVWDQGIVERDADGQPARIVGMTMDISARKEMEEELAEVQERLRLALAMTGLTVAYSDTDARYTWIYNPHPDFYPARILGKLDDELESHAEAVRLTAVKRQVLASGIPLRDEFVYPVSDGVRTYDVTLEPRRDATGAVVGLLTAALDVTELKRTAAALEELNRTLEQRVAARTAELQRTNTELERSNRELERSNRELDRFAYVASHDLKSPLRAIDNLAAWVVQDALDHLPISSQEHLAKLRSRVRRLEVMLDDLLHYSRAGRHRHGPEWVDTAAVAHGVAATVRRKNAAPPTLEIAIAPDLPALYCERDLFTVVLHNLIDNAVKHHHAPATAVVAVSAFVRPGEVEFCVADNGPGISPEYHERIFEVFQTLRPRDEVEGSGMGLAIVKKTVATHGGRLWLDSAPGSGAAFHLTWPQP